MKDPNPLVSGRGIRRLRRQGVDVQVGVLRKEAEELNRAFRKHITTGLPYVHLKIAQTVDGKIAPIGERKFWLTSEQSRGIVHRWRAQHDAVLVGAGTIRADDPLLTARKIAGRNPDAVILDGRLAVDPRSRVFVRGRQRRVFLCVDRTYARRHTTKVTQLEGMGVRVLRFAGRSGIIPLRGVLRALYGEGIGSLLVEGGATVFRHFVEQSMVDELSLFVAPWIMGDGVAAFGGLSVLRGRRRKKLTWLQPERIGTDLLLRAYSL
jgi:diaminohydroxyphosphoribosylaminopyrimidine deaminase/5-amino-6-(5-phosphoribosylamino)uracil reductase